MPVQVPVVAVSVWPSFAVPLIVGATVLTGGAAVITAVWALVALLLPTPLVAVTVRRSVLPTSVAVRT